MHYMRMKGGDLEFNLVIFFFFSETSVNIHYSRKAVCDPLNPESGSGYKFTVSLRILIF